MTYCAGRGMDLPNKAELQILYNNRASIPGFNASGTYFSGTMSSYAGTGSAWIISNGSNTTSAIVNDLLTYCVRKN